MSDFFQTGAIATLHRLGRPNLPRLEQEMERFSEETPIALVLPCHIRELGTRALKHIVRELKHVTYLRQIVVGIDGATRVREFRKASTFFYVKVAQLLHAQHYSLQSNRKTEEGDDHPDRDAQFRHINALVKRTLAAGGPVISVDTKKKELVGNYDNAGQQWLISKRPRKVSGHDFPDPEVPRAFPYGIYDLGRNAGFVNVGTDHDTGAFAVASIRGWWRFEGRHLYPEARQVVITADGGGSNGSRLRLWKLELQRFADETGLSLSICHFPPGTSKWNKIEHRLFSFISSNWRGEPLRDYETIVHLIAKTTTAKGLTVTCRLDRRKYPTGRKVTDEEMKRVNLERNKFHGDWNYVIKPASNA
jgi:hypothetical protein